RWPYRGTGGVVLQAPAGADDRRRGPRARRGLHRRPRVKPMASTELMRAAVLAAPGEIQIEQQERPEPGLGEVRIRLEGCGVCASNLEPWTGLEWMTYPGEPGGLGHEGWGVVDAVGPDVTNVAPGDRVAALSYRSFAEYDLARAEALVRLPPQLDGQPFPGEPLGCAFNIFRRSDIQPGQMVAI